MSKKPAIETPSDPPAKARKPREKHQHYLEKLIPKGDVSEGTYDTANATLVDDVDAAIKYIRENDLEGEFRVIAVKRVLKVRKEQKTVLKFE